MRLLDETLHLLDQATPHAGPGASRELDDLRARLIEPLRVALIGRVKAGKSTLLNALVGDLVAPTDAAECTMIVTEYHSGPAYRAWKVGRDDAIAPARFLQDPSGAHIALDGTPVEEVTRLLVEFPSPLLEHMTLVDTPGLGSVNEAVSQRTVEFTSRAEQAPADAVVYLLRNWHAVDSDFLAGFHDRVGIDVPPVNALAVLSRADETAGGGPDALERARELAHTLADDPTLRSLVVTVVPVAGLLAETAAMFRESDYRALRRLLDHPAGELEQALLSVDRLTAPDRLVLVPAEQRRHLVERLGLFGMRHALAAMAGGRAGSTQALCQELTAVSGLDEVRSLIFGELTSRAATLRATHALDQLEAMMHDTRIGWDDDLAGELERIRVNAFEIAELKMLNAVLCSSTVGLAPGERAEVAALLGAEGAGPRHRLRLAPSVPLDDVRTALRAEIARWQARATSPTSLPMEQRLAHTVVRSLSSVLASTTA